MKKNYISPSITVVQIETETILAASGLYVPGMDRTPSEPGKVNGRLPRPSRYDFFEDDDF